MTRGRRPFNAIDEAVEIAARRGSVEQVTGKRACSFDFIIIGPDRIVFVKVKRSRAPFTYALEVMNSCQREIASLHQVPLTSVTAREFWVRSPKGAWQFFLVRNGSVQELPAGDVDSTPESLSLSAKDLPCSPSVGTGIHLSPSDHGK
ncbi:MAG TPA: hypothetical protein VFG36_03535 [Methanoregula sp.]|nr:hypothetical protein [Methanoregula sp.]